ncbi:hypothetical protein SJ617_15160, partial [Enterococcus faecium]
MEQNKNNNVASTLARQGMKQVSKKIGLALKIKIGVVIGLITLVGLLVIGSLATLQGTQTATNTGGAEVIGGNKPLSPEVQKWQKTVEKYAEKYGIK